ncbi:MAG: glycosyltransferase family 2 protein [Candidatus Omnitrophota bacterium]
MKNHNKDKREIIKEVVSSGVSFVIPMYNERETVSDTITKITEVAKGLTDNYEIIIANDGSSDGSGSVVDAIAKRDPFVRPLHLAKNTKFGGAFSAGLKKARNEIIIYTDSDLPINISDIENALSILKEADAVTAYSKVKKGETLKRVIISKVYNFLIQSLFRTGIKDINSGFKIYRKKIFSDMKLTSKSPFIDVEIFLNAKKKGYVIKQYPIVFKHRKAGKSYISRPAVILATMMDMLRIKFFNR